MGERVRRAKLIGEGLILVRICIFMLKSPGWFKGLSKIGAQIAWRIMVIVAVDGANGSSFSGAGPGTGWYRPGLGKVKWYPPSRRCTLTLVDEWRRLGRASPCFARYLALSNRREEEWMRVPCGARCRDADYRE